MTLTTHGLAGAAIASLFPTRPVLGFAAGFASHFALDAIPHWDYKLRSLRNKEDIKAIDMPVSPDFWIDLLKIGFDCLLGLLLGLLFFANDIPAIVAVVAGTAGGIVPDALQFVYFKIKREPLVALQHFHKKIQGDRRLQNRPVIGIAFQILILACLVGGHFLVSGSY